MQYNTGGQEAEVSRSEEEFRPGPELTVVAAAGQRHAQDPAEQPVNRGNRDECQ